MSVKVSQMPLAESVGDGDLLMIVQDGQSKKIPASMFQQTAEPISNANRLQGYGADEFMKSGETAYDSDRLGGKEASQYATKQDLENKYKNANVWSWCCPQLWFSATKFPNKETPNADGISTHFALCAGQWLNINDYKDLHDIIGNSFDTYEQEGMFQLPDLRGRFAFGADINRMRSTNNLPNGLYSGDDFTTDGQWKYPQEVGKKGGDPTTCQDSVLQLAFHSHSVSEILKKTDYTTTGSAGSSTKGLDAVSWITKETSSIGNNRTDVAVYPPQNHSGDFNYGMLSMPPYLTFAYIMQIKPF